MVAGGLSDVVGYVKTSSEVKASVCKVLFSPT